MMRILDILNDAQNGALTANIARQFDSPIDQTGMAMAYVVDELVYNIERNTLSNGGLAELVRAIGDGHHLRYLEEPDRLQSAESVADGIAILSHVTGSKHASRKIAARAARESGLDASTIEKMLPIFAAVMMGGLDKQTRGPLADIMGQLTSSPSSPSKAYNTGDSSDFDVGQHQPLPVPGDHVPGLGGPRSSNPFEDFSDVIRGGRSRAPSGGGGAGGGGSLWNLVRSLIGSVLGFRSTGIFSWILRFIVYRYGWRILSSIARRVFLGR